MTVWHGMVILGWLGLGWMAVGIEAAWGGGMPGPLLLVALSAGLRAGPLTGMAVGALAGLTSAAVFGGNLAVFGLLGMACGGVAGIVPHWLSRQHLLTGAIVAFCLTFPVCLVLGYGHYLRLTDFALAALARGGENTLWMIPIYGIVLLVNYGVNQCRERA